MIDQAKFSAGMAILAGNFSRTLDNALLRVYYRALSASLTTNQFEQAVQRCVEEETFWPPVATIIGKIKSDETTNARIAFEHVNRVTSAHGGFRFLPFDVYQREFDEPTRAAIAAVGGLSEIANTSTERWEALAKRFSRAHVDAAQPKLAAPDPLTGPERRLVKDV